MSPQVHEVTNYKARFARQFLATGVFLHIAVEHGHSRTVTRCMELFGLLGFWPNIVGSSYVLISLCHLRYMYV